MKQFQLWSAFCTKRSFAFCRYTENLFSTHNRGKHFQRIVTSLRVTCNDMDFFTSPATIQHTLFHHNILFKSTCNLHVFLQLLSAYCLIDYQISFQSINCIDCWDDSMTTINTFVNSVLVGYWMVDHSWYVALRCCVVIQVFWASQLIPLIAPWQPTSNMVNIHT